MKQMSRLLDQIQDDMQENEDFFWGFAFSCFERKKETILLFRLLNLVQFSPEENLFMDVLRDLIKNLRKEHRSGLFINRYLHKMVLNILLFNSGKTEKFISQNDMIEYFFLIKNLLKILHKNEISDWMEVSDNDAETDFLIRYQGKVKYLNIDKFYEVKTIENKSPDQVSKSDPKDMDDYSSSDEDDNDNEDQEQTNHKDNFKDQVENSEIKKFIDDFRKKAQNLPKLDDLFKEFKLLILVEEIKIRFPDMQIQEFEKNKSEDSNSGKKEEEAQNSDSKSSSLLNQQILNYFLFKNKKFEQDHLKKDDISKAKVINYLLDNCSYSSSQKADSEQNLKMSKIQFKDSISYFNSIHQNIEIHENEGLFFDLYNLSMGFDDNDKESSEIFEKLLTFLIKVLIEKTMDKSSISIEELSQYKRVFQIFIMKKVNVNKIISFLANTMINSFVSLKKNLFKNINKKKAKKENKSFANFFSLSEQEMKYTPLIYFGKNKKSKEKIAKIRNKIKHKDKFLIILSWIFGLDDQKYLVLFIDKLSVYWKLEFFADYMDQIKKEEEADTIDTEKFFDKLAEVIDRYVELYDLEQADLNNLKEHMQEVSKHSLDEDMQIDEQIRDYYYKKLAKLDRLEQLKENIYERKLNRMCIFLKKLELICLIRNMGQVLCTQVEINDHNYSRLQQILQPSIEPESIESKIRQTIRYFFLDFLNVKKKIFKDYHPHVHKIFPESKKTDFTEMVLVDSEASLKRFQELEGILENEEKNVSQKYVEFKDSKDFYLLAISVLNQAISKQGQVEEGLLLNGSLLDVINLFKKNGKKLEYHVLKNLAQGFHPTSCLNLAARHSLLPQRHKTLAISILLWVITSSENQPFKVLLQELVDENLETRKYILNVKTKEEDQTNNHKKTYIYHHLINEKSRLQSVSKKHSVLWHMLLHGFYIGIIETGVVNKNQFLEGVQKFWESEDIDSNQEPIVYFTEHFSNDIALLSRKYGNENIERDLAAGLLNSLDSFSKVNFLDSL